MKKKLLLPLSILVIISLISCNQKRKYIDEVLDIVKENSIKQSQINWEDFRLKVYQKSKDDKTKEDAHNTIKYALSLLNDHHSMLLSYSEVQKINSDTISPAARIDSIVSHYENGIGYIKIPAFIGNEESSIKYSTQLQNTIKQLDRNHINGWIIDLRDNIGGNMWPMLLGIGPIIGNGVAGYFVDSKNNYDEWVYSEGKVFAGQPVNLSLDSAYELKNKRKKIAILINNRTLSSGEAIAVAFKGLPNTRFFGISSGGLTTGNKSFVLSDKAILLLTTSIYADRNKTIYGKSVTPDEIITKEDPKVFATNWILRTPTFK